MVSLYPSIPHEGGFEYLYNKLEERDVKKVSSKDLVEMVKLVLKNNYFEFDGKFTNKLQEQPLVPGLHHPMHVCLWIGWRQTFLIVKQ